MNRINKEENINHVLQRIHIRMRFLRAFATSILHENGL